MGQKGSVFRKRSTTKSVPRQAKSSEEEEAPDVCEETRSAHPNEVQTSGEKREIWEAENVKSVDTGTLETSPQPHLPQLQQASEDSEIQEEEFDGLQDRDFIDTPLVLDEETIEYVKRSRVGIVRHMHDFSLVVYSLEYINYTPFIYFC